MTSGDQAIISENCAFPKVLWGPAARSAGKTLPFHALHHWSPGVQTGEEIIYTSPLLLPLNHCLHQQFEGGNVSARSLPPPNWPLHELAFWEASNQRFQLHFFQRTNEVFLVLCTFILLWDQVTQLKIGKKEYACSMYWNMCIRSWWSLWWGKQMQGEMHEICLPPVTTWARSANFAASATSASSASARSWQGIKRQISYGCAVKQASKRCTRTYIPHQ